MDDLAWMEELCGDDMRPTWIQVPHRIGDKVVATDGHAMIVMPANGSTRYAEAEPAVAEKFEKFLKEPLGEDRYSLTDFKKWINVVTVVREDCGHAHECKSSADNGEVIEFCRAFGCLVDRRLLRRYLKNVPFETMLVRIGGSKPDSMLVLGDVDWRVLVMGCRETDEAKEVPVYGPERIVASRQTPAV